MKHKLFVKLLTGAALLAAHAQAGGTQRDMPQQNTDAPQEQHVIASPNPTIDDSKTAAVGSGEITSTKIEPAATTTAAPMKKATRPKRGHRSRQ